MATTQGNLFDQIAGAPPAPQVPTVTPPYVECASGSGPVRGVTASQPTATPVADATVAAPGAALEPAATVLVFDVETTGTDRKRDQIIELCLQLGMQGEGGHKTWRFLPSVEMSPGAQAVHGISMDDLKECPSFRDSVDEVMAVFARATVIVGYNVAFDIDMLQSELARVGYAPLDLSSKLVIDPFRLWQQCEPRSLQHAHKRFVGGEFEAAHSATADVAATGRVLEGMLAAFGLPADDWTAVADVCDPSRLRCIGPSRHFMWNDQGHVVIAFGKHAGTTMEAMVKGEGAGYLRWVCGRDFPSHVVDICEAALARAPEAFVTWVVGRFGAPPTV